MDKLKSMGEKMLHKGGNKPAGEGSAAGGSGNMDYGDKGLAAAEKKFGVSENRERDEKITDAARGQFEKATGKHVPDKFSN